MEFEYRLFGPPQSDALRSLIDAARAEPSKSPAAGAAELARVIGAVPDFVNRDLNREPLEKLGIGAQSRCRLVFAVVAMLIGKKDLIAEKAARDIAGALGDLVAQAKPYSELGNALAFALEMLDGRCARG